MSSSLLDTTPVEWVAASGKNLATIYVTHGHGAITQPAWRTKPSWYLITTEDKMIPPDAQRAMSKRAGSTVVEIKGSHAVYVSHPQAVAHFIEQAATGALAATKGKP